MKSKRLAKTSIPAHGDRAWIEDGILYAVYDSPMTIESIIAMLDQCYLLIHQSDHSVMPLVCSFTNNVNTKAINIGHIGRTTNHELIKRVSVIVLVNTSVLMSSLLSSTLKLFLNDRVRVCDTVKEATDIARKYRSVTEPILEQQ